MELLVGFRPFISDAKEEYDFVFEEGNKEDIPTFDKVEYTLEYEDVKGTFAYRNRRIYFAFVPRGKRNYGYGQTSRATPYFYMAIMNCIYYVLLYG